MKKDIRRCVQCRVMNHRLLMFQLSLSEERQWQLGAGPGRSWYLCRWPDCIQRAAKNKNWLKKYAQRSFSGWQILCADLLTKC